MSTLAIRTDGTPVLAEEGDRTDKEGNYLIWVDEDTYRISTTLQFLTFVSGSSVSVWEDISNRVQYLMHRKELQSLLEAGSEVLIREGRITGTFRLYKSTSFITIALVPQKDLSSRRMSRGKQNKRIPVNKRGLNTLNRRPV